MLIIQVKFSKIVSVIIFEDFGYFKTVCLLQKANGLRY